MKHFDTGAWADFARGQVTGQQRLLMAAHLAECGDCARISSVLQRICTLSLDPEPPPHLIEAACEVFPSSPVPAGLDLPLLGAKLLARAASVGFRRQGELAAPRVRYQVDGLVLELQLQREPGRTEGTLVGMLGHSEPSSSGSSQVDVSGLPVYLLWRGKVLSQTSSNPLGEFLLDFVPRSGLRLCLPLPEAGGRIEVSLKRLLGL